MRRIIFGSASRYLVIVPLAGLPPIAVCKRIALNTQPDGAGAMTGIYYLGRGVAMMLLFAAPALAGIGSLPGAIGSCRAGTDLANEGVAPHGLASAPSPAAWSWALPA